MKHMKTLTAKQLCQMYIDNDDWYGFSGIFEGTFGGRIFQTKTPGIFVWMDDDESAELSTACEQITAGYVPNPKSFPTHNPKPRKPRHNELTF